MLGIAAQPTHGSKFTRRLGSHAQQDHVSAQTEKTDVRLFDQHGYRASGYGAKDECWALLPNLRKFAAAENIPPLIGFFRYLLVSYPLVCGGP